MVTPEETKALLEECEQWRQKLRDAREEVNAMKNELLPAAEGQTEQEYLQQVEHFQNQFHIQLINIHDLKHEIKHHVADTEHHPNFGHKIPHHQLEEKLNTLLEDIHNLRVEFHQFIGVEDE